MNQLATPPCAYQVFAKITFSPAGLSRSAVVRDAGLDEVYYVFEMFANEIVPETSSPPILINLFNYQTAKIMSINQQAH